MELRPEENWGIFSSRLNSEFEKADFQIIFSKELKSLLYVRGYISPEDADIRLDLLKRIEKEPDITPLAIVAECYWIENLKKEVASTVIQTAVVNQILQSGMLMHPPDFHLVVGLK
ncbi:hypothetical protein ACTXT7_012700 [Hymenolepis weldensis]